MRRRILVLMFICLVPFRFSHAQEAMRELKKPEPPHPIDPSPNRPRTAAEDEKLKCMFQLCTLTKPHGTGVDRSLHLFDDKRWSLAPEVLTPGLKDGKIDLHAEPGFRPLASSHFYTARDAEKARLGRLNRENPGMQRVKVELQLGDFAHRYVVYSGELGPDIYSGNDVAALIRTLHSQVELESSPIVMEFEGFTEKEERAFTTEFSVQHQLIDRRGHFNFWVHPSFADKEVLSDYRSTAIVLERVVVKRELRTGEREPRWGSLMQFAARAGDLFGMRKLWVQVWFDRRSLNEEFLTACLWPWLPNPRMAGESAEQMVERSRKQLKANHPDLSDREMEVAIRSEFSNTGLGELFIRKEPAGE
ncbi:MAG TPA: hypothetical protein VK828_12345 [Terriglobales bacterium]|jgi:hypothetical protein|nr:hypothetical protein [Terriglobales bacterium]